MSSGGAARGPLVVVGRIAGAYGVRGEVKVYSYTQPPEQILQFSCWLVRDPARGEDGWRPAKLTGGRVHGKAIVARLDLSADRDTAMTLRERDVAVAREQLPPTREGEYYWADLLGLEVINANGLVLGRIASLIETGANDVLVVQGERERLIPFVLGRFVLEVDLAGGVVRVDWEPDF